MSSRRSRMLEEMGLGPVWVLRDRTPLAGKPDRAVAPGPRPGPRPDSLPGARAESRPAARPPAGAGERPARAAALPPSGVPAAAAQLPALPDEEREVRIARMDWPALKAAVAGCTGCGLAATRTQAVFGVGDEMADWMLVGEAPGAEEDVRGEPFVGQAGRLLDNMLAAIGLARGDNVYIANVLKCRPPGNRNPAPEEVARCGPHLARQVALVQPKLILALGRFAAQTLLGSDASIASLRGRLHGYRGVPVIVTYHPAYLLRNLPDKAKAWEDLVLARRSMASLQAKPAAP